MYAVSWGTRLFGKVDAVPGRYHVATRCWTFCYLPLVPRGTYLVLSERATGLTTHFQGVPIRFSGKSLLMAWWRTLVTVPFVILSITAVALPLAAGDPDHHVKPGTYPYLLAALAVVAAALFGPYFVPGLGRATTRRAAELAALAGPAAAVPVA